VSLADVDIFDKAVPIIDTSRPGRVCSETSYAVIAFTAHDIANVASLCSSSIEAVTTFMVEEPESIGIINAIGERVVVEGLASAACWATSVTKDLVYLLSTKRWIADN
jgi:hypothetical protein